MMRFLRAMVPVARAAAGAVALAAGLAGMAEAALVWRSAELSGGEGPALLVYAFGLHAAFGALGGLLLGAALTPVVQRIERLDVAFTAAALGALALAGGVAALGSFHLLRDAALGKAAALGLALGAAAILGALFFVLTRRLFQRAELPPVLVVLGLGALLWGSHAIGGTPAAGRDAEGAASAARPNVVFVVVDTLRADSTGPWGGRDEGGSSLTPNLDRFAAESVRFERAYANATWTRPAVATLLTGRLPKAHGVMGKASALPREVPTLASTFAEAGYATAATVTNVNLAPDFGLGRGHEAYRYHAPTRPFGATGAAVRLSLINVARLIQERMTRRFEAHRFYADAPTIVEDARELLEGLGDGPFFLWVHFMDPHDPFFRRPFDGHAIARVKVPRPDPALALEMRALYADEVRFWDESFGAFMDDLRARGLLDTTAVVVTADHGEEFMDHGGYWHGQTLFDELSRIPLLVRLPGAARAGETDTGLVSQVDLAPTLLALGGSPPAPGMTGVDILDPERPPRPVVLQEDHDGMVLEGLIWDRHKLVRANAGNWRGLPEVGLYDLVDDPGETQNLAAQQSSRVAELESLLDAQGGAPGPSKRDITVDSNLEEDLRSLGYVQ